MTNRRPLVLVGGALEELPSGDTLLGIFDPSVFVAGKPLSSELLWRRKLVRAVQIPAAFSGSYGTAVSASTGTAVFTFEKNGTPFGTLTFTASDTGVFAAASATSFAAGDVLTITAPSSVDATLENIAIDLKGSIL